MNTYRSADGLDPEFAITDEARSFRSTASSHTEYDASGQAMSAVFPDDAVSTSPLAMLGSLDNAQVTEGVLVDESSADPSSPRALLPSFNISGQAGNVERLGTNRLRITIPLFNSNPGVTDATVAGERGQGNIARTYHRRDGKWVLEELVLTSELTAGKESVRTREVMRLRNVQWYENKAEDARRRAARQQASQSQTAVRDPLMVSRVPQGKLAPGRPSLAEETCIVECDSSGGSSGGGGGSSSSTGQNVVFQHGGFSSGSTWDRMDPWLSASFSFATKLKPSLSDKDRIEDQATDLIGRMEGTGQSNFLMIGHSNGGLISRNVAQRRGDLITGVVTVSSPHDGVLLALNTKSAVNRFLQGRADRLFGGCSSIYADPGCWLAGQLTQRAIPLVVNWAIDQTVPMVNDVQPKGRSDFLNRLNSTPEAFTRVGIENHAKKRFVFMRMIGDSFNNPEDWNGGRNIAKYTQWAYTGFQACRVVGTLTGNFSAAGACAQIARRLDDVDRGYDRLTAPGEKTDGLVQGSSQAYPNATRRYAINNSDSHVGEVKSDLVRNRLTETLQAQFQVPTK